MHPQPAIEDAQTNQLCVSRAAVRACVAKRWSGIYEQADDERIVLLLLNHLVGLNESGAVVVVEVARVQIGMFGSRWVYCTTGFVVPPQVPYCAGMLRIYVDASL